MFFHILMEKDLHIYPRHFGPRLKQHLQDELVRKVEGTCSGRYGFIITVTQVLGFESDEEFHSQIHGRIKEGMGFVTFPLQYQAIVFRPFKGEVLDAIVTLVNKMGFFAEVGPLQVDWEKGCWGFWGVFFLFGGNQILRWGKNGVRHKGEMGHSPNIFLSLQVFVSKHAMPSDFAFDPQVLFF